MLREALKTKLPDYMVPSAFVPLEALPLLPSGKVDKKALAAADGVHVERARYTAPATATEELLASIWSDVLGVERISVHDHFFELGGHSLLATRVVSRIRSVLGVELALKTLFEAPTLAELARAITQVAGETAAPPLVAQARPASLPLSFAQQRLWFLDQLEPGSAAYNIPAALRMRGRLEVEALRRTIETIVERHEALRTTFVSDGGEPRQEIHPATGWALPCIELAAADDVEGRAQAEAAQPFDLAAGPLLRTTLLRLGDEEHVLLVTMHHIVSDGWSLGVLVREVMALYPALAEGTCPTLAPLPVQYADFALWQRGWLQGEVLDEQLGYWRERLAGVPALALPTDRARPAVASHRGATHAFGLPAALTSKLRRLGRQHGATLYMTLLAAFEALLYRYSEQESFAVGTPIANRTDEALEPLIGFFVNTLALRANRGGQSELRRAAGARAEGGARRLRAPGGAVRATGRGAWRRARSGSVGAVSGDVHPAERAGRRAGAGGAEARRDAAGVRRGEVRCDAGDGGARR